MDYQKSYLAILIIDLLILALLSVLSFRFLRTKIIKTKELNPEIMAQYEVNLEIEEFVKLINQLEKH